MFYLHVYMANFLNNNHNYNAKNQSKLCAFHFINIVYRL